MTRKVYVYFSLLGAQLLVCRTNNLIHAFMIKTCPQFSHHFLSQQHEQAKIRPLTVVFASESAHVIPVSGLTVSEDSQLAQLAKMTTLSIDSGDLRVIRDYANTGYITDATTNPLFVSQAGVNGDPAYVQLVDDAVQYAIKHGQRSNDEDKNSNNINDDSVTALAIDRLAVNLGKAIAGIVKGRVSTEVDPRLSFDTQASIDRAHRIIEMYKDLGVSKDRIMIKLAATWEGIQAAAYLEKEGIQCNLTLVFSTVQGIACAQYGAYLISPFPGRILDWHNKAKGRSNVDSPDDDEGVIVCRDIYNYYKTHNHDTISMPASWRPSRGPGYDLDEIRALAGSDRMTIPAPLLEKLSHSTEPLQQKLSVDTVPKDIELIGGGEMSESEFRYRMLMDECGSAKLEEGIRAFIQETIKLEQVLSVKIRELSLVQ